MDVFKTHIKTFKYVVISLSIVLFLFGYGVSVFSNRPSIDFAFDFNDIHILFASEYKKSELPSSNDKEIIDKIEEQDKVTIENLQKENKKLKEDKESLKLKIRQILDAMKEEKREFRFW